MTAQDLAHVMGIKEDTARYWCRRGLVEAVKDGRSWYIDEEEVQRVLEERLHEVEAYAWLMNMHPESVRRALRAGRLLGRKDDRGRWKVIGIRGKRHGKKEK